jgi:hypothetical protein
MTTDQIDRIDGVVTSAAVKYPVRVATTAPITMLGLFTVDGIALADGDRILVKDQADQTTNGIYNASASLTTNWVRAIDFDGVRDATDGTLIYIRQGAVNQNVTFRTVCADNPIQFDTSLITFTAAFSPTLGTLPPHTYLGNNTGGSGPALDLTATQLTAELNPWTPGTKGLVPATGIPATATLLRGYIDGLAIATAGGTNVFSVAPGLGMDSTNVDVLSLGSTYTKTTSNWVVGSTFGALDTGTISINTWYNIFLIKREDSGVVDVLCSLSLTPSMPTNYTLYRLIGARKTDGSGNWIATSQNGDEVLWGTPIASATGATVGTTPIFLVVAVPLGRKINALLSITGANAFGADALTVFSPDSTVTAATNQNASLQFSNTANASGNFNIRTDTSGRIKGVTVGASGVWSVTTWGYIDRRGKDS